MERFQSAFSKRPSIMVIDDETDILAVIRSSLKRKGYEVDTFSDSSAALESFKSKPANYDLIISDIRMPKVNGFEFSREARKVRPDIKIIFMTAFEIDKREFDIVMPSLKISGFISKPFHAHRLYDVISQVIFQPMQHDKTEPSAPSKTEGNYKDE